MTTPPQLPEDKSDFQFQVLHNVEKLPGTYMFKDGEWVPYDGSDVSEVMVLEKWTVRPLKKSDSLPTTRGEGEK